MGSGRIDDASVQSIIDSHERSVPGSRRRELGVHYTPAGLARAVVDQSVLALGGLPGSICDPTCGAGAMLVAAANALHDGGLDPQEIVTRRLSGCELDPSAAETARRALTRWAEDRGEHVEPSQVRIVVGDALGIPTGDWPFRPATGFDLVIGNPPFLNQLSGRTARSPADRAEVARRFGQIGAYADGAGLFLMAAIELVRPGGVAAMVQPQSLMAARDGGAVRDHLLDRADLVSLWGSDQQLFDADVLVCVPALRRRRADVAGDATTSVIWDGGTSSTYTTSAPVSGSTWGPLLARALGLPPIPAPTAPRLATVATATAGFRDEFYALVDAIRPAADPELSGPRLVTVGMIDPLRLRWDSGSHRIGGQARTLPRIDLDRLATQPRIHRWVVDRLRPKVLVATQTKVVEAVVDAVGDCVPMTPTISVEPVTQPRESDAVGVWHLAAALSSPPVAARALSEHLGAGRNASVLRWSARAVLNVELPHDRSHWESGAELARAMSEPTVGSEHHQALLHELGAVMTEAYGMDRDGPVLRWWSSRLPKR